MSHSIRTSERGFTLVELMVATAISLIVIGGIFGVMIAQQQSYMGQMELAEASQNARASLDMIRQALRGAGWGFVAKETAVGLPPVGTCYAANVSDQSTCNDLVANNANGSTIVSDKLRIVGIDGSSNTFTQKTTWSGSSAVTTDPTGVTRNKVAAGELAIMSGTCTSGSNSGKTYTNIVKVTAAASAGTPAVTTYTFSSATGYPTFDCGSMQSGFSFGKAKVVEFYIDRFLTNVDTKTGNTNVPRLMMITNRGGLDLNTNAAPVEQTVAYDIEMLQVRYALDCGRVTSGSACSAATSANPDDIIDLITTGQQYCNDLTSTNCNTGKSVIENQMRVMGVQVAVVPRTRNLLRKNSSGVTTTGSAINIFGATLPGDSYRHWVYRSTVALRNNQLPIVNP